MSILARKTVISKWQKAIDCSNGELKKIPADLVTSELRTKDNTLSTWEIVFDDCKYDKFIEKITSKTDNNITSDLETYVSDVVLSLLTGPKISDIESMGLILINSSNYHLDYKNEKGDTSIEKLSMKHYNICNLDYEGLGKISTFFFEIVNNNLFVQIPKNIICKILKRAIDNGDAKLENFSEKVRPKVKKIIQETHLN